MKITIEQRSDDYIAYFTSTKGRWEAGKSPVEAVGKLILNQAEDAYAAVIERDYLKTNA